MIKEIKYSIKIKEPVILMLIRKLVVNEKINISDNKISSLL